LLREIQEVKSWITCVRLSPASAWQPPAYKVRGAGSYLRKATISLCIRAVLALVSSTLRDTSF
jgi:hypothetical protein